MNATVSVPVWIFVLILLFAGVTFASHFLFPSVRWFFRKRAQRAVARLNTRLARPIEPFKLTRRHDMIQRLIYSPEVAQAVVDYAADEGVPEAVAFEKAGRYAREIVPSFSATMYFGIAIRLARWLSRSLYEVRMGQDDPDLSRIGPETTVVFVMNHRSNMDYVLVTYLVADRSALSYAVGEWAHVWPLSRLIRSMGAYFIRRKSRDTLYRRVLARYVQMATAGGVTQAVFPEGGLSLDGALAPPKLGLLSYMLDAVEGGARDIVFVPVALNYDRVLEDRLLIRAAENGNRRFPARITVVLRFLLKKLWMWATRRAERFGCAGVSFGEPLSLNVYRAGKDRIDRADLANTLMRRVGDAMPVLPVPLVASVLLAADAPLDRAGLEAALAVQLDRIDGARDWCGGATAEAVAGAGLKELMRRKIVRQRGDAFYVNPADTAVAAYYARSIQHRFCAVAA